MKKIIFVCFIIFALAISYLILNPYKEIAINKTLNGLIYNMDGEILNEESVIITGVVIKYKIGKVSFSGEIDFDTYTSIIKEQTLTKSQFSNSFNSYQLSDVNYEVSPLDNYLYASSAIISTDFSSIYLFRLHKTNNSEFKKYENNSPLCLYATNTKNIDKNIVKQLIEKYNISKLNHK